MDHEGLSEIETRYTYLERLVEELSRVVYEQQRSIDGLTTRLSRLESLVADAVAKASEQPPHEKPPHY